MKKYFSLAALIFLLSCADPPWAGKYKSESCTVLEYVQMYQDKTADLKYYTASFAVNKPIQISGKRFRIDQFIFEWEGHTLKEVSGSDWGCVLVRDSLKHR